MYEKQSLSRCRYGVPFRLRNLARGERRRRSKRQDEGRERIGEAGVLLYLDDVDRI